VLLSPPVSGRPRPIAFGRVSALLVFVLWLLVFVGAPAPAWAGVLLLDVLDIGQGDCILVRAGGKTALIDAADRGKNVTEQLDQLGVTRLDLVVATHPHADHIGSMLSVVQKYDVGLYMDNGLPHTTQTYTDLMSAIEERQIRYQTAVAGTTISMGGEATLTVLFPAESALRGTRSDLNSNSVVLLLQHGTVDVLLTGDSEQPTEQAVVTRGLGEVDILKVAHHGSGHSSTAPFLAATKPKLALISVGVGNRYGHPDPEAIERLHAAGAEVYRTDLSHHLRVVSDGSSYEVFEGTLAELGATWPLPALGAPLPTPAADPDPAAPAPAAKKPKKAKKAKKVTAKEPKQAAAGSAAAEAA
jgi:competence protein ComEC